MFYLYLNVSFDVLGVNYLSEGDVGIFIEFLLFFVFKMKDKVWFLILIMCFFEVKGVRIEYWKIDR